MTTDAAVRPIVSSGRVPQPGDTVTAVLTDGDRAGRHVLFALPPEGPPEFAVFYGHPYRLVGPGTTAGTWRYRLHEPLDDLAERAQRAGLRTARSHDDPYALDVYSGADPLATVVIRFGSFFVYRHPLTRRGADLAGLTAAEVVEHLAPGRDPACVFCRIVTGQEHATVLHEWEDALAIVPLGPVVDGHVLVLPRVHVADFRERPEVTAAVMGHAAQIAPHPSNLITSAGEEATQSVFHLHVHIVPRAADDGLALPWYSGKGGKR